MSQATAKNQEIETGPLMRRVDGAICRLTLNRPDARNALSHNLIAALQAALNEIAEDRTIKVILLEAAGKVFCAGHDLKEVRALKDEKEISQLFTDCAAMMQTITSIPQPVIALVQGVATAAGCQLVATADLAIAADAARFATPGVHIGLFCSTPMVPLSRVVAKKHAMEMLLTGDPVSAEDAFRFGLVNRIVPADTLQAEGLALARKVADKSGYTISLGKKTFYEQKGMPFDQAYAHCCEVMTKNLLARDAEEGVDAFLQKRPPVWPSD